MSLKKNAIATVALTGIAVAVSSAYAAGFQLTEQSSLGLGRAYAGAGIVGDDLSAVHYNAAGMTLLPGTQIQAGSVFIEVDAPFSGDVGSENGRLKGQAIPHGYITHQVNDQWWVGLGLTVPFGMGTEYNQTWGNGAGAMKGNQSMILTLDINPNIAFKVNEKLSVGGGISIQYAKAELGQVKMQTVAVDTPNGPMAMDVPADVVVKGDSWHYGFNLGVMYEPTETLRFGLAYRSQIGHDASGDARIEVAPGTGAVPVMHTNDFSVRVTTPDTVMATATWEATPDLRLSGLVRWARWSNLDQLDIHAAGKDSTNVYDWEDTWLFSVGADYKLNGNWTVRGGLAYETGAPGEAKNRPATIPDVDRVWFSLGGTYHYNKQIQFDFGATYLMGVGNMDLCYEGTDRKMGEYDHLDAYILGAQLQYRF